MDFWASVIVDESEVENTASFMAGSAQSPSTICIVQAYFESGVSNVPPHS